MLTGLIGNVPSAPGLICPAYVPLTSEGEGEVVTERIWARPRRRRKPQDDPGVALVLAALLAEEE